MTLKNKVLFITGASRGIGLAIALRAARDGAKIVIAAKTITVNDKLPGTIYSAAEEIKAAGGEALAIACDVRDEEQIKAAIAKAVETFGGIDIVVNNAGAIQLTNTEQTDMKRFDLMQAVNARAVYMTVKHALPHLKKSSNAHVLSLSPPINLDPDWFAPHLAYTLSKYGMSLCTLGLAAELKKFNIGVNSLWPETAIDTAAVRNLLGGEQSVMASRKPEIVADAAYWIFNQPTSSCTGNFFIDSAVLTAAGETDLTKYAVDAKATLLPDFFIGKPPKSLPRVKASEPGGAVKELAVVKVDAVVAAQSVQPKFASLSLSTDHGVSTLTFTNAKRSNAMGEKFWQEFPQAIKELIRVGETRVLIICGEGDNFSAGIDLSMFQGALLSEVASEGGKDKLLYTITRMQDVIGCISKAPFPVIAAVHGACLGAGLDLAAACDFRYCSASAAFAIEEINLGIMADLGSLQRLPLIMPAGLVREMAFSGRRIAADRALSSGLVNAIYSSKDELLTETIKIAQAIAGKSPKAISATKQSLNYGNDHGVFEALHLTAKLQTRVIDPAEILAAVSQTKRNK